MKEKKEMKVVYGNWNRDYLFRYYYNIFFVCNRWDKRINNEFFLLMSWNLKYLRRKIVDFKVYMLKIFGINNIYYIILCYNVDILLNIVYFLNLFFLI